MVRVWSAKHKLGSLDLLRACLAELCWEEETREEIEHGLACDVCYCDRVVLSKASQLNYRELAPAAHLAISRIEEMSHLADKAETERAIARCREAGMPGYATGAGSYFPKTWLLPEQLAEFKQHVQKKRIENRGRNAGTFIIKPSDGSEGETTRAAEG